METEWVDADRWPAVIRELTDAGWWLADLCGVDRLNLATGHGKAHVPGVGAQSPDTEGSDAGVQERVSASPTDEQRFEVVAQFLHHARRERATVHVAAAGDPPTVPSVTELWPSADFMEREAFDLVGIVFDGHPNLKRIMLPDEWEGHPLRKDYGVGKIPIEFIPQPFLQFDSPHQQPNSPEAGAAVDRLGQAEIPGGTTSGGLSHLRDTKAGAPEDEGARP